MAFSGTENRGDIGYSTIIVQADFAISNDIVYLTSIDINHNPDQINTTDSLFYIIEAFVTFNSLCLLIAFVTSLYIFSLIQAAS